MIIDILCSDKHHPVIYMLLDFQKRHSQHDIKIFHASADLRGGDILFLVSCSEFIQRNTREKYIKALTLHASDLPEGRGWSPHIWQVLDGRKEITVSLIDAKDKIDTGDIWEKLSFDCPDHALFDEINAELFETEFRLMEIGMQKVAAGEKPIPQSNEGATYWPKRNPADSQLDVSKTLSELFDQIRVCDPDRYPAFFELRGHAFKLKIEKIGSDDTD